MWGGIWYALLIVLFFIILKVIYFLLHTGCCLDSLIWACWGVWCYLFSSPSLFSIYWKSCKYRYLVNFMGIITFTQSLRLKTPSFVCFFFSGCFSDLLFEGLYLFVVCDFFSKWTYSVTKSFIPLWDISLSYNNAGVYRKLRRFSQRISTLRCVACRGCGIEG